MPRGRPKGSKNKKKKEVVAKQEPENKKTEEPAIIPEASSMN